MDLTGKWIVGMFVHCVAVIPAKKEGEADKSFFRTGEIVGLVGEFLLIRFDDARVSVPVHELVRAEALLAETDPYVRWVLFASRADLDKWIEWCESGPAPEPELVERMERPRTH